MAFLAVAIARKTREVHVKACFLICNSKRAIVTTGIRTVKSTLWLPSSWVYVFQVVNCGVSATYRGVFSTNLLPTCKKNSSRCVLIFA